MARSNRLLSQVGYFAYINELADEQPDEMLVATWGVTSARFNSRLVVPALHRMQDMVEEVRILVGVGTLNFATRSMATMGQAPEIVARYTFESHAKFVLSRTGKTWKGAVGSTNLSDSDQMNFSYKVLTLDAYLLSKHFNAVWERARDRKATMKTFKETEPLMRTVYEPNSTERR